MPKMIAKQLLPIAIVVLLSIVDGGLGQDQCPQDGLIKVASLCLPLQSKMPVLLGLMTDLAKVQEQPGNYNQADINKMKQLVGDLCQNSNGVLACLSLLGKCPSVLSVLGSSLPPDTPQLINDGSQLLQTMCKDNGLEQYVNCLERNNGVNIKTQYCSMYNGPSFGDFSSSFSSFSSLIPGAGGGGGGNPPPKGPPINCQEFTLYSGCMASNVQRICSNPTLGNAFYSVSLLQAKAAEPPCSLPPNLQQAANQYRRDQQNRQPAETTTRRPARRTTAPTRRTRRPMTTVGPRYQGTTRKTLAPCPDDGFNQVISLCLPLQSQLPNLLNMMQDLANTQDKQGSFTQAEIGLTYFSIKINLTQIFNCFLEKMRSGATGLCESSNAVMSCLNLLERCPSVLSVLGSSLPPNTAELISDGSSLLDKMCRQKTVFKYINCIDRHSGVNIQSDYCGRYEGVSFGDFSSAFGSFSNLLPGSGGGSGNTAPAKPLNCKDFGLYAGCMYANLNDICQDPAMSEVFYYVSQVQAKNNQPPCQIPASGDEAERIYRNDNEPVTERTTKEVTTRRTTRAATTVHVTTQKPLVPVQEETTTKTTCKKKSTTTPSTIDQPNSGWVTSGPSGGSDAMKIHATVFVVLPTPGPGYFRGISDAFAVPLALYDWTDEDEAGHRNDASRIPPTTAFRLIIISTCFLYILH